MTWNYRVLRNFNDDGTFYYQIHETYYDTDGKIMCYSDDGIKPYGETVPELKDDLLYMIKALDKPVLDYETLEEIE